MFDICVTVHHLYNNVSNQQDATTFSFINLYKSALFFLPVGISVSALYKKLYIQSKSAPEDGRIFRPKHVKKVADL